MIYKLNPAMKKFNFVYVTTNLINGKQYIGSHSTNNVNDNYLGSGRIFLKSIQKYGKQNFKREILIECDDILDARKLESSFIIKYNTLIPNGYNVCENGGLGYVGASPGPLTRKRISEAVKGYKHTEEAKRKISIASKKRIGDKHPFYGKHHTNKTLEKISESRKGLTAKEKHHYFGKHRNDETKKKIANTLHGRKTSNEIKEKLSESGKNVKKIICEYCQHEFAPWVIDRHRKTHLK